MNQSQGMNPLRTALVIIFLSVTACGGSFEQGRSPTVEMRPFPSKALERCRAHVELRPACPTSRPAIEKVRFHRANASKEGKATWVFLAEWNAAREGLVKDNAPPAFAHINVMAGDLRPFQGFDSVELGTRSWGGLSGRLLQAPGYPEGGMEGNHLVFTWSEGPVDYSVSLHAWDPVAETEATLKLIVQSLPNG